MKSVTCRVNREQWISNIGSFPWLWTIFAVFLSSHSKPEGLAAAKTLCENLLQTVSTPSVHFPHSSFSRQSSSIKTNFQMLPYPQGCTAGSSAYLFCRIFTTDAFPDATPEGFLSPHGIKLEIFCLLGKGANPYTVESLDSPWALINNK